MTRARHGADPETTLARINAGAYRVEDAVLMRPNQGRYAFVNRPCRALANPMASR
jgi:hypothetical protein